MHAQSTESNTQHNLFGTDSLNANVSTNTEAELRKEKALHG